MEETQTLLQLIRPGEWHGMKINRIYAEGVTRHQKYRILELDLFGKCMELNGCIQSTEFDESYYHESLIFPAITHSGSIKRVLCFGGANGGIINRLSLVPSIEEVYQIDIDPEVYHLSKYFLPHMHVAYNIPFQLNQIFCDSPFSWATNHTTTYNCYFDLIIADLPDATSDSYVPKMFTKEFYQQFPATPKTQ